MDNSVAAAADSYEETPVGSNNPSGPTVVAPTTPPPPPPPPSAQPTAAAPSAPALSLPSVQASAAVPEDDVLDTAAAPEPVTPIELPEPPIPDPIPDPIPSPTPDPTPTPVSMPSMPSALPTPSEPKTLSDEGMEDLFLIKQDALHDLSPLVAQLEQTAEEKFRTLMMMIQAADDQDLIRPAYEAAHEITDEKIRAQALLDIVNEINYFTQHQAQTQ